MTWPLRYQWLDAPPAHRAAEAIDLLGFVGVAAVSSSLALALVFQLALPLRMYARPTTTAHGLQGADHAWYGTRALSRWRCYCTCA